MKLVMRPVGGLAGDATNALGGIGDGLQGRRTNIDLTYLGELSDTFQFGGDPLGERAQVDDVSSVGVVEH